MAQLQHLLVLLTATMCSSRTIRPIHSPLTLSKDLIKELATTRPLDLIKEPGTKSPITLSRDLLKELDTNQTSTIEKTTLNNSMEICWHNIVYVNDTHGNHLHAWRTYKVTFQTPTTEASTSSQKEYKKYGVVPEGNDKTMETEFEVVSKTPSTVISKHVVTHCGKGQYLFKSYQKSNVGKTVVIRLTNNSLDLSEDCQSPVTEVTDSVVGKGNSVFEKAAPIDGVTIGDSGVTRSSVRGSGVNRSLVGDSGDHAPVMEPKKDVVGQSCSSILTKVLTGSILPDICKLQKDEKILFQGEILVSKKYFDVKNDTLVVKPWFVIRENTEIASTDLKYQSNNGTTLTML